MKITLEPTTDQSMFESKHCFVAITHPSDDLCMQEVIEDLIKPVLLAWGFHPTTVDQYFTDEE